MTAVQEGLSELATEIYSHVPELYHDALQQLFDHVPGAREQFERGNTATAFKMLIEARAVKLNPKECGPTSKEGMIAAIIQALPTTFQTDLDPDA